MLIKKLTKTIDGADLIWQKNVDKVDQASTHRVTGHNTTQKANQNGWWYSISLNGQKWWTTSVTSNHNCDVWKLTHTDDCISPETDINWQCGITNQGPHSKDEFQIVMKTSLSQCISLAKFSWKYNQQFLSGREHHCWCLAEVYTPRMISKILWELSWL